MARASDTCERAPDAGADLHRRQGQDGTSLTSLTTAGMVTGIIDSTRSAAAGGEPE